MPEAATPIEEEIAARKKHKALEKARKAAAEASVRRSKAKDDAAVKFKEWLVEERLATEAYRADPKNDKLKKDWIAVWHRQPRFKDGTVDDEA